MSGGTYRASKKGGSLPTLDFRRRHEAEWVELEGLVDRALRRGLSRLDLAEVQKPVGIVDANEDIFPRPVEK